MKCPAVVMTMVMQRCSEESRRRSAPLRKRLLDMASANRVLERDPGPPKPHQPFSRHTSWRSFPRLERPLSCIACQHACGHLYPTRAGLRHGSLLIPQPHARPLAHVRVFSLTPFEEDEGRAWAQVACAFFTRCPMTPPRQPSRPKALCAEWMESLGRWPSSPHFVTIALGHLCASCTVH